MRNKRDSGGSTGSNNDKDKDKEKDKDKPKKRSIFEDDLKSPKKRQKTVNATGTPVKVEPKTEAAAGSADSNNPTTPDAKKKPRKIFKKNDDEEADAESEDAATTTTTSSRDLPKFYPANYSGVMVFNRKAPFPNSVENFADEVVGGGAGENSSSESPKKRQIKTFGPAAGVKSSNELLQLKAAAADSASLDDSKKKATRKILNKPEDNSDETDDTSKELAKYFPNFGTAKALTRNKPETDDTEESDKPKKPAADEDAAKSVKKRQKTYGSLARIEAAANSVDNNPDPKKKPVVRRLPGGRKDSDESDEGGEGVVDQAPAPPQPTTTTKYFSHYSGPKAKAAAAIDAESLQDRLTASKLAAAEAAAAAAAAAAAQPSSSSSEPTRLFSLAVNSSSHDKDKSSTESTTASVDPKQGPSNLDAKKRLPEPLPSKSDAKPEPKPLDFTPIVPHALPVPAPISTRLPATASIEEKLSAAAVFRSKLKETKKEEDSDNSPTARKTVKDIAKKFDMMAAKKLKEKEDSKIKPEPPEKKKNSNPQQLLVDQSAAKKDPLQEMELRKDPLLEVMMKKKEEEMLLLKAKAEPKPTLSTNTIVTKTYGGQKKEAKLEEAWKKGVAMAASSSSSSTKEEVTCDLPSSEMAASVKDYVVVRKETIVSKIKSSLERDSVDSTDSSDSERRLTIIDSEDFPDDKRSESSSSDVNKSKTVLAAVASSSSLSSSVTLGPFSCAAASVIATGSGELARPISVVGLVSAMLQTKSARMEEDGENLNSLLCEEEIPGSPTPGNETLDHEHRATSSHNLAKSDIGKLRSILLHGWEESCVYEDYEKSWASMEINFFPSQA